ncbi:MAG: S-layer homology domain-containing protein, partial [Actinomycetota bacterium]
FLDAVLPHVDCVRWIDLQTADATGPYREFNEHHERINALIHEVAAEYDDRVEYVHYGHWTEIVPPGYIDLDGLHLAPAGRRELGRLIRAAADGCDEASNPAGFWDVKPDYWASDAVAWMVENGLATGYDNRTYRGHIASIPVPVSRGQVAGMLFRLAGSPPTAGDHPWSDGAPWIDPALDWLADRGVAGGHPDGTFRPTAPITRAEILRMLWRLAGSPGAASPHPWPDGAPWIDPALDWAAEHALYQGYNDGLVRPSGSIDRSQTANLLHGAAPLLTLAGPPG